MPVSEPPGRGDPPEAPPDVTGARLGERLRTIRKEMGWTLQDLARKSGVSLSTLSKIENAQVAPTFDTLVKAARGLGVTFEMLLAQSAAEPPIQSGRRPGGRFIVTKSADAVGFSTAMYDYGVHANGLRRKHMTPLIMTIKARSLEEATNWSTHEGEEFILVLSGSIEMHTEFYEPVRLEVGDSAYIDSGMAHMFLNLGGGEATMASICYSECVDDPPLMASMPAAEFAEP